MEWQTFTNMIGFGWTLYYKGYRVGNVWKFKDSYQIDDNTWRGQVVNPPDFPGFVWFPFAADWNEDRAKADIEDAVRWVWG